jgi:hypothetical protein
MVIYKLINKIGKFNMKKYIFCCFVLGAFFSEGYAAGNSSRKHRNLPHPPMVQELSREQQKLLEDALKTPHLPTGRTDSDRDDFEEIPDPKKQQEILGMIRWKGMLADQIKKAEEAAKTHAGQRESHMDSIRQRVEGIWRSCGIYAIPTNAEIDRVFKDKDDPYRQEIKDGFKNLRDLWARTEKLPG